MLWAKSLAGLKSGTTSVEAPIVGTISQFLQEKLAGCVRMNVTSVCRTFAFVTIAGGNRAYSEKRIDGGDDSKEARFQTLSDAGIVIA